VGIPLNTLPKTFRESIIFTRLLGIRYLWIDSLCIAQDLLEDWRQEFGLMSKVYTNAVGNIAATASSDGDGGLFCSRTSSQPEQQKAKQLGKAPRMATST